MNLFRISDDLRSTISPCLKKLNPQTYSSPGRGGSIHYSTPPAYVSPMYAICNGTSWLHHLFGSL
jgi:hypothetical protein